MRRLPEPTYTVPEAEKLLGIPEKRGYALIKVKRIKGVVDVCGKMRVPAPEVYAILRNRERGVSDM